MKLSALAALFLSTLASASPFERAERYVVTELVLETATVTVTEARPWRPWSSWHSPTVTIVQTSTTTLSTSTVFVTASISSSEAPASSAVPTSPAVTPSEPAISSSPPQPSNTQGSISPYADPILKQHNLHRDNHTAPALQWNETLVSIAREIAETCYYAHSMKVRGGGYGQNIGAGSIDEEVPAMITNGMYNSELMFYPGYGDEPNMAVFEKWGHFSQIVWRATESVGCYTHHCTGGLGGISGNISPYYTVCNYYPAGNVGGVFKDNVVQPRGDPTVTV